MKQFVQQLQKTSSLRDAVVIEQVGAGRRPVHCRGRAAGVPKPPTSASGGLFCLQPSR